MDEYVKMPESDYAEICDEIRRLTGSEALLTSGDIIDALSGVDGVYVCSEDAGKVVPDSSSSGLITQTSLSVASNDTYDTTTKNQVVVNVQVGRLTVGAATMDGLSEQYGAISQFIDSQGTDTCFGRLAFTANLGGQTITNSIPVFAIYNANGSYIYMTGGAYNGSTMSCLAAFMITSSSVTCQQMYLIQNGVLTDLTANAGTILSSLTLRIVYLG